MKNLINELYNYDNCINGKKDEMYKTIPHFCHLRMNQSYEENYNFEKDFCIMRRNIYNKFTEKIAKVGVKNKKNFYNICCCQKEVHNINQIFFRKNLNENVKKCNYILYFILSFRIWRKEKVQEKKIYP